MRIVFGSKSVSKSSEKHWVSETAPSAVVQTWLWGGQVAVRTNLSAKLIKSLWLLATFQLSDNKKLLDSVRKVLNQNKEKFYENVAVGIS